VLELDPERLGRFDLVLLLGVLYHMRHPLLALERVASVTGRQLILETAVDCTWTRRPAAAFYPGHALGLDPTNWWGPNPEAVVGMLQAVGFSRVEVVSPDGWAYRVGRSARRLPATWRSTCGIAAGRPSIHRKGALCFTRIAEGAGCPGPGKRVRARAMPAER
jgi:tRNA (mo5U34)-methyltransferase